MKTAHRAFGLLGICLVALAQTCPAQTTNRQLGSVVGWGISDTINIPPELAWTVIDVAAGACHGLALRYDATVRVWGCNNVGQKDVPVGLTNVVAIAAGDYHCLALRNDGAVVTWGWDGHAPAQTPEGLSNVVAISARGNNSMALRSDNTVVVWGVNDGGLTNVPTDLNKLTAISAGDRHCLALESDGTVRAWGDNTYGQVSVPQDLTNAVAVAAGWAFNLAVKRDGTLVAWGLYSAVQQGFFNVVELAAGNGQGLVLQMDGRVVAWNSGWQPPVELTNAVAIAAGTTYNLAIIPSRRVLAYINGSLLPAPQVCVRGSANLELVCPFCHGLLLYTLDGSDPRSGGYLYEGPLRVTESLTVRAIAYAGDLSDEVEGEPLQVTILPALTVIPCEGGSVEVQPPEGAYSQTGEVTLTAIPEAGCAFLHWLGDAHGTNPVTTLNMSRARYARAVFGTELKSSIVGAGSILLEPQAARYPFGASVRLTAIPSPGSYLVTWGGAVGGTNNPVEFIVRSPEPTVSAAFATIPANRYALTVVPDGLGQVSVSPYATRYTSGQPVTISAEPKPAQEFLGWSGDARGTNNPLLVTMNAHKVITAHFTQRPSLAAQPPLDGLTDEGFRFSLVGEFGAPYQIDGSPDLVSWSPLGNVTNLFGTVQFTDPAGTNFPLHFYRATRLP